MMKNDYIPFHRPLVTDDEINEVVDTVKSGWWTTGPKTLRFESEFRSYIGAKFSLAVSSWTAAAHLALEAMGLKEGDEVIVPSFTFTASAEIVCYFKAKPVIVDVDKESFNISPEEIEKNISDKTKAVIPVHYGGNPCNMDAILELSELHNLRIIEDAAHSLPAKYKGKTIGTIGDATCFSFYVTKTLAAGEGGMICTDNEEIARRCSIMRLHGINSDAWKRYSDEGSWYYEVVAPGYKYNFTDIQASLGLAQLKKIDLMREERKNIFEKYNSLFADNTLIKLYKYGEEVEPSYHLYPVLLQTESLTVTRSKIIEELKNLGIGTSVHFIPLYRHPYYRETLNPDIKNYPVSEHIYPRIITLPIWPGMTDAQIERVASSLNMLTNKFKK